VAPSEIDADFTLADDELELLLDGSFEGLVAFAGPHWKLKPDESKKLVKRTKRVAKMKGSKARRALEDFEKKAPGWSLFIYVAFVILLPRLLLTFDQWRASRAGKSPAAPPPFASPREADRGNPDRVNRAAAPETPAPPAAAERRDVVGHIDAGGAQLAGLESHHRDGRAAGRPPADGIESLFI